MATLSGKFEKYHGSLTVKYKITDKMKDKIIHRLLEYYNKNCHSGESIHHNDDSILESPSVLSDIADNIIHFKEEWDNDE